VRMTGDFADDLQKMEELVDNHVYQLMEHFDAVQIFVSRNERAGKEVVTVSCSRGAGNIHARIGHVREYLIMQGQRARNEVTKSDMEDKP